MYKLHSDRDFAFTKESVDELHEFDVKSYKQASALIFEGVPAFLADAPVITDGADGVSIIESALQDLTKVSAENTEPLISFYSRAMLSPILEKANIVITIPNTAEVDKIRPQFLLAEAKGIGDYMTKFLKGEIDGKELMYQVDKLSVANSKKNISKTILDTSKDINYLARQVEGENVFVDRNFIRTRIVPFLSTYPATQSMLVKEANSVIAAIKDSTVMVSQTVAAVNSAMESMDKLKSIKVAQYMYKVTRKYIELRSYTAFIMTRKILNYTHTMLQYYNLYTLLTERFPEGSRVLHENVLDGELAIDVEDYDLFRDMTSANGSLVDTKISNVIGRRSSDIANATRQLSGTDALNQIGISYCDYDKEIYDAVKDIFTSFTSRVNDFKNAIMNGEIFDDAQAHTGFDGNLTLKYNSTIANFSSVKASDFGHERTASEVPIDLAINAFGELKNMSRNLQDIRTEMQNADSTVKGIKEDFETSKTSQTEISPETLDEAIGFITKLYEQFQHLVVDVTKAAFQRAVSLDNMIEEFLTAQTNSNGITIHESADDFIPSENLIEECKETFIRESESLEMAKEYFAKRNFRNEGLHTIYEAETTTAGTATTTTSTPSGNTGGASSTPSNNTDKKSGSGWVDKFTKWIKDFIDKIVNKAGSLFNSYEKFNKAFEKDILEIPEDRIIGVTAVNYFKINPAEVIDAVNKTCEKAKSDNYYSQNDETTIASAILPEQVAPKDPKEKVSDKARNFYINMGDGTSKESISPNVISSNRKAMIDYCNGYVDTITNLKNTVTDTCNQINNKAKALGLTTESVITNFGDYLIEAQETTTTNTGGKTKSTGGSPVSFKVEPSASEKSQDAANTPGNAKDDENAKLAKTYDKATYYLMNYFSGVSDALEYRFKFYKSLLASIHQNGLDKKVPPSINSQINAHKESSGEDLYGVKKIDDTTWRCYFYTKDKSGIDVKKFKISS